MKIRTFVGSDVRHGTTSGHARHLRSGEEPCESCRTAKSEYDARYRSAPQRVRKSRMHAKAQTLALGELRRAHLEEYARLYHKYAAELRAAAEETP